MVKTADDGISPYLDDILTPGCGNCFAHGITRSAPCDIVTRFSPKLGNRESPMVISDRLRVLREQKHLSQGDIEKRTGLLRCYISRIENGHTVPAHRNTRKDGASDGSSALPTVLRR
jgi:hypothetical protein